MATEASKLKLAHSLVGFSNDGDRPEDDFYPTPPEAVQALLGVESFWGKVWEPACGDGAISKVLIQNGYKVVSSDKYDHGYGDIGVDFLESKRPRGVKCMVTNSPFKLGTDFIRHADQLDIEKFAILSKLQLLEGIDRSDVLEATGLARVWVFRKRMQLTRNGEKMKNSGMIAFAWFIWDRDNRWANPTIGWI